MISQHIEELKLIAEFRGLVLNTKDFPKTPYYEDSNKKFIGYPDSLTYFTSSWEILMEVVEKIESMDYGFKMCRKVVEVYIDSTKEVIIKTKEKSRKESLFKAVVEFIKYYNQITNKKTVDCKK